MSHRVLFVKHGLLRENAPNFNGLGRFIPQLQRVTLKFCKESVSSYGVRRFIEEDIVKFAEQNPHVAIYLKPRRHRRPVVVAEYLNGKRHWQSLDQYTREHMIGWMDYIRTASGREYQSQRKNHYTDYLSVQGMWNSYVNEDPKVALAQFPDPELTGPVRRVPSASEQLVELYKLQKEQSKGTPESEKVLSEEENILLEKEIQK